MGEVYLLALPSLDINYKNVMDFSTIQERDNYFYSKRLYTIPNVNIKIDGGRETLAINLKMENVYKVDYLYLTKGGKKYFYFITNKEVINETRSVLTLKLDVWTTYMFDHALLDSFVERCHQPRWNGSVPHQNTVDEGFPLGEYIQEDVETLYTYNNGLIIATTSPLGKVDFKEGTSSSGSGSGSGNGGSNGGSNVGDNGTPPSGTFPDIGKDEGADTLVTLTWYGTESFDIGTTGLRVVTDLSPFTDQYGNHWGSLKVYMGERFLGGTYLGQGYYKVTKATLGLVGNVLYLVHNESSTQTEIKDMKKVRLGKYGNLTKNEETYKGLPYENQNPSLPKVMVDGDHTTFWGDYGLKVAPTNRQTPTGSKIIKYTVYEKGTEIATGEFTQPQLTFEITQLGLCTSGSVLYVVGGGIDYPNGTGFTFKRLLKSIN